MECLPKTRSLTRRLKANPLVADPLLFTYAELDTSPANNRSSAAAEEHSSPCPFEALSQGRENYTGVHSPSYAKEHASKPRNFHTVLRYR